MKDLSVIIPARNEIFLNQTVENVLENIEGDSEIIAICDGYMPSSPLPNHPRVKVVHYEQPIGQRAATNAGARMADSKYIMKLDAHCAVDKGFDIKLMEDCQPDWVMIPQMYNLHAFDWECKFCKHRTYQGAKPKECEKCHCNDLEMVIVWKPRLNRLTVSWRFDKILHFQYWPEHRKRPECQGDLIETMSFIGACMFCEKDRYWQIDGLDESHGSWGQFGTEIACKSWLSGGKLITSKKTWYAHMFRTSNFFDGNSTWPYPITQKEIDAARAYSQDLWLNNKWPKAIRPLSWIIEHFAPVPDWH